MNITAAGATGRCAFYWNTSTKGKQAAQKVVNEIKNKGYSTHGNGMHASVRGSWTNLAITRQTNMPAVLVEYGFMTTTSDFNYIFGSKQAQYLIDMADATAKAICSHFGVSYKGSAGATSTSASSGSSSGNAIKLKDERADFKVKAKDGIKVRQKPSTSAKNLGVIPYGAQRTYDSVYKGGGYRWVSYVLSSNGNRVYVPYRPESDPNADWVEFLPASSPAPTTYTVKKGDTLYSVAKANNLTVDKLKELNDLDSNVISIGQELKISTSAKANTKVEKASSGKYTVKKGDTLWAIANANNTTVDALKKENNLDSDVLSIGQELTIPSGSSKKEEPKEDTGTSFKKLKDGDTATIGSWATHYATGEAISDYIKNRPLKVSGVLEVKDSSTSDTAYRLLNNTTVIGKVLEQDIVEADDGRHAKEIEEMKSQNELVEEGKVEKVDEKSVDEAKKEEKETATPSNETLHELTEGQFVLNGVKYEIVPTNKTKEKTAEDEDI